MLGHYISYLLAVYSANFRMAVVRPPSSETTVYRLPFTKQT